jgi:hypothetical protein
MGTSKYNKTSGITPMNTHIDNVHFPLLTKKNFVLSEKVVIKFYGPYHNQ